MPGAEPPAAPPAASDSAGPGGGRAPPGSLAWDPLATQASADAPRLQPMLGEATAIDRGDRGDRAEATLPRGRAAGSRLGRFIILGKLGQGGMGEVYSGYDEELDRRVALKVVRHGALRDTQGHARMKREAQVLARLSHPNVVQVYEVYEVAGDLFIAMEFIRGETLGAWQATQDPKTREGRAAILRMYMQAGQGLAAAHAAGIVHRDFKPENVLVGGDGRARVVDFGLAREETGGGAVTSPHEPSPPGSSRSQELTVVGTILGTPAYMSPEQFAGAVSDHRSDLFSFCVALYQALYAALPFPGATVAERRAAVLCGLRREPPPTPTLPPWLPRVLDRGLARAPEDRYPSMTALLAALAEDPEAARQRWLRGLARTLAVAAAVVGVVLLGQALAAQWSASRLEAQAEERRLALEDRVQGFLAQGAPAEAERAFYGFLEHPAHRGTAALGRAWLFWAGLHRDDEATQTRQRALAAAYTVATAAEDREWALVMLAQGQRAALDGATFIRTMGLLGRHEPVGEHPELAELTLLYHLSLRDLEGAAALLRAQAGSQGGSQGGGRPLAVLEALIPATQTPATQTPRVHDRHLAVGDLDGDGLPELAWVTPFELAARTTITRAGPDLRPFTAFTRPTRGLLLAPRGPGEPALLLANEPHPGQDPAWDAALYRWEEGELRELVRWPEDPLTSAAWVDVDGDGARELLVGSSHYTRQTSVLREGAGGVWTRSAGILAIDRRRSDIHRLLAADLDGDGEDELVAVLGPWNAYELMVLRRPPEGGALRPVSRRRLGMVCEAILRDVGEGRPPELVVAKQDRFPNKTVFPPEDPYGEAAGIYRYRLVGDRLEEVGFTPTIQTRGGESFEEIRLLAGDLDGDGVEELIVFRHHHRSAGADRVAAEVWAGGDPGEALLLGGVVPLATVDLDGDGDDELVVARDDPSGLGEVWILGSGDDRLPRLALDAAETPLQGRRPPLADPVVEGIWRRAEELAGIGLLREAAVALRSVADLLQEPALRGQVEVEAGELLEMLHDDASAQAYFARAAAGMAAGGRAHAGLARTSLGLGDFDAVDGAIAAATAVGAPVAPGLLADWDALRRAPGFTTSFDVGGAWDRRWAVDHPFALRLQGASRGLLIDHSGSAELLRTPLQGGDGALSLAVELDVTNLEWGASLAVVLREPGVEEGSAAAPLKIELTQSGGDHSRAYHLGCASGSQPKMKVLLPFEAGDPEFSRLGQVRFQATVLPGRGVWTCRIERKGALVFYDRQPFVAEPRARGSLELLVETAANAGIRFQGGLRSLEVRGVSPGTAASSGRDRGLGDPNREEIIRRILEGDRVGALQELQGLPTPGPRDRLMRVVLLAEVGRWREAEAELQGLFQLQTQAPGEAGGLTAELQGLLRREPEVYAGLLRGVLGGRGMRELFAESWASAVAMEQSPEICERARRGLAEIDRDREAYDVLQVHAFASHCAGRLAEADASYRAAARALDAPERQLRAKPPAEIAIERTQIALARIELALAMGERARAEAALQELLTGDAADLWVVDRVRSNPQLRALRGLVGDALGGTEAW